MNTVHGQLEVLGRYDAVVVGGGVTGTAAARTMAAEGLRVGLVEQVSSLGREIVRARSNFIDIAKYKDASPTIRPFYERLQERKCVFPGIIDANGAAVVFDELLERHGVDVLFHTWPSSLLTEGSQVEGIIAATNNGYARIEALCVIDASERGKLSRALFKTTTGLPGKSALRILFSGITGQCPAELTLRVPELGELHAVCRPTFWPNEWQVSLHIARSMSLPEWAAALDPALVELCEQAPALAEGIVSYMGNDVCAASDFRITASSQDETVIGSIRGAGGETPITRGMIGDPAVMSGFYMAGMWIDGLHYDPFREEEAVVSGFALGDIVGREAAAALRGKPASIGIAASRGQR
jgi:hypothetical protein